MKVPPPADRVHIAGTTFRLTLSRKRLRREATTLGPIRGFSNYHDAVIGIDPSYTTEGARNILLHEVLHMSLQEANIVVSELLRDVGSDPDEVEERIVRGLASPLLAFLRRNPELVEWLRSDDV